MGTLQTVKVNRASATLKKVFHARMTQSWAGTLDLGPTEHKTKIRTTCRNTVHKHPCSLPSNASCVTEPPFPPCPRLPVLLVQRFLPRLPQESCKLLSGSASSPSQGGRPCSTDRLFSTRRAWPRCRISGLQAARRKQTLTSPLPPALPQHEVLPP